MQKETFFWLSFFIYPDVTPSREKWLTCVKRDLHVWNETLCIWGKRPIYVKRDLHMWKETYMCEMRHHVYKERDLYMWKETLYMWEKRPTYAKREQYMWHWWSFFICIWRDSFTYAWHSSFMHVTWLIYLCDLHMWKETYICKKRDLHMQIQKNTCDFFLVVSLHLYSTWLLPVKIDLYMWKETYICGKRPCMYLSSSVLDVTPPHMRDIWGSYD